ncbi:MAG: CinA family protein [Bacteroidota bacterium]
MIPDSLIALAEDVVEYLTKQSIRIAMAESGTGGLASGLLTTIPGSSKIFHQGFVCYSNISKEKVLKVPSPLMIEHGAVSEEVTLSMAKGALSLGECDWALAESCIAGPSGGSAEKPLGLSYVALVKSNGTEQVEEYVFKGDRRSVRVQVVQAMLQMLLH